MAVDRRGPALRLFKRVAYRGPALRTHGTRVQNRGSPYSAFGLKMRNSFVSGS